MKRIYFYFISILFLAATTTVSAQDVSAFNYQEFVAKAASGNMMEVELGKMAQERASSEEVVNFAEMMVEDHSKAQEELRGVAEKEGYTFPGSMMREYEEKVERLSQLSGESFDQVYMETMVEGHEKAIKSYEKAADKAPDQTLKTYAQKTLNVLKQHYQRAQEIEQMVQASAKD
ncbi:MAG: DUF4142 domain-containing protein [Cyclobacteriaceae bacterium]